MLGTQAMRMGERGCTEQFSIACHGVFCCHPNCTLRYKPADRFTDLSWWWHAKWQVTPFSNREMASSVYWPQRDSSRRPFVLDPITTRYNLLARTSNEPMTEHCDELITETIQLSLSLFYIMIPTYSSCWIVLDLFSDAFQLHRLSLQSMAVIIWKIPKKTSRRLFQAISPALPWKDWRNPWSLQS